MDPACTRIIVITFIIILIHHRQLVSTFVWHARKRRFCLHLSKAFDELVRQVVFGVSEARVNTDMIIDSLVRSGEDAAAASHLAPIIASSGDLLHQLKVPAHICNMVGRLHDQTWFQIEPEGKLIMTTRGSRQGCRFGSVIFNAVYGVTHSELLENIKDHGACLMRDRGSRAPLEAQQRQPAYEQARTCPDH